MAEADRRAAGRSHNEDRDHPDAALERGRDLDSDEVGGLLKPAVALGVPRIEPVRPDHRQENVAGTDGASEDVFEVRPEADLRHVHEHRRLREAGDQGVVEAAGVAAGVPSAVADEDSKRLVQRRWTIRRSEEAPLLRGFRDAGGGTRTPDTRIMIPLL